MSSVYQPKRKELANVYILIFIAKIKESATASFEAHSVGATRTKWYHNTEPNTFYTFIIFNLIKIVNKKIKRANKFAPFLLRGRNNADN